MYVYEHQLLDNRVHTRMLDYYYSIGISLRATPADERRYTGINEGMQHTPYVSLTIVCRRAERG